jgi:hypothetical protein
MGKRRGRVGKGYLPSFTPAQDRMEPVERRPGPWKGGEGSTNLRLPGRFAPRWDYCMSIQGSKLREQGERLYCPTSFTLSTREGELRMGRCDGSDCPNSASIFCAVSGGASVG